MPFVRHKFQHVEHNTTHTLFQFITRARLTLVDDTTKWRSIKSLQRKLHGCAICCLKSAFHTCTPGIIYIESKIYDTVKSGFEFPE